jgi:hypothetical protein
MGDVREIKERVKINKNQTWSEIFEKYEIVEF